MIGWLIVDLILIVILIALMVVISMLFAKKEKTQNKVLHEKEERIKELEEKLKKGNIWKRKNDLR